MSRARVEKDEWYPVYFLTDVQEPQRGFGTPRLSEFTDEELARIESAFTEFDAVQDLLESRHAEANKH